MGATKTKEVSGYPLITLDPARIKNIMLAGQWVEVERDVYWCQVRSRDGARPYLALAWVVTSDRGGARERFAIASHIEGYELKTRVRH